MELPIALGLIYIIGFNLCFWMLSTEIKSEGHVYTKGDRIICLLLSTGSLLTILWALAASWVGRIKRTGYWNKPVDETVEKEVKPIAIKPTNGVKTHAKV